jgi:hypothetical protein
MLQNEDVSENALLSFTNDIKSKQQFSSNNTSTFMDNPTSQNQQTLLFNVMDSPVKCENKLFDFDDPKNNIQPEFLLHSTNQEGTLIPGNDVSYKGFNQEVGGSRGPIETHEPTSFNDLFNQVSLTTLSIKKNEEKLEQWNSLNEKKRREREEKELIMVQELKEKAKIQLDEWYRDKSNRKNQDMVEKTINKKSTDLSETNSVSDESLKDSENFSKINWKTVWKLVKNNSLQCNTRLSSGNLSKEDRLTKYKSEINNATNNEKSGQKHSECDISRMMQIIEQLANA